MPRSPCFLRGRKGIPVRQDRGTRPSECFLPETPRPRAALMAIESSDAHDMIPLLEEFLYWRDEDLAQRRKEAVRHRGPGRLESFARE